MMDHFNVEHHAVLFALFAREAEMCCGDAGREAVLEGVRRYGHSRGGRMAEHARERGLEGELLGYLVCGELDFGSTANTFKPVQKRPYLQLCATQCAWDQAWRKTGMLEHGRLYCQAIDRSLVEGYDPDFHFEVEGTLSSGDACCRFHFHDGKLGISEMLRYLWNKKRVGKRFIRSWDFHTAELYWILATTLREVLANAEVDDVIREAMAAFGERYGQSMVEMLEQHSDGEIE